MNRITDTSERYQARIYSPGQLAMYGSCQVRINSAKLRGIAAPLYRFSCTDYSHEHPTEWGTLTSYELLRPIPIVCPECEHHLEEESNRCHNCYPAGL